MAKRNYGGAYDIDPNCYWCGEDARELAAAVEEYVVKTIPDFKIEDVDYDENNVFRIHGTTAIVSPWIAIKVDLRRAGTTKELIEKYTSEFGDQFIQLYREDLLALSQPEL